MVRRSPRRALGTWRAHRDVEPGVAVPPAPSTHPSQAIRREDGRRHAGLPAGGWVGPGGSGATRHARPDGKLSTAVRWVTRARPKTDRIACPWLIRRFIDPEAEIVYVPAEQVLDYATREGARSFDSPGAEVPP